MKSRGEREEGRQVNANVVVVASSTTAGGSQSTSTAFALFDRRGASIDGRQSGGLQIDPVRGEGTLGGQKCEVR